MSVRELTRSRMAYCLGFCEISYEISFGILWDLSYEFSCVECNVLKYYRKQTRSNNWCLVLNQPYVIHSNLIEIDKLDNKNCFVYGIKYIFIRTYICHKCKCKSIQSALRRLKVCLTLFIFLVLFAPLS